MKSCYAFRRRGRIMWRKLPRVQRISSEVPDHRPNVAAWSRVLKLRRGLGTHVPVILLPSQLPLEAEPADSTVKHSAIQTEVYPWMIETQPQPVVRPRKRKVSNPPTWLADLIATRPRSENIPIWLRKTEPLPTNIVPPRFTLPIRRKRGA